MINIMIIIKKYDRIIFIININKLLIPLLAASDIKHDN